MAKLDISPLLSEFWRNLEAYRSQVDDARWASLLTALEPTLEQIGEEVEVDSSAPTWDSVVRSLDASSAGAVSTALIRFSLALTEQYRSVLPRDNQLGMAIGFLYADVARPLWAVHRELAPVELRNS